MRYLQLYWESVVWSHGLFPVAFIHRSGLHAHFLRVDAGIPIHVPVEHPCATSTLLAAFIRRNDLHLVWWMLSIPV
jgi:hypothetical protein